MSYERLIGQDCLFGITYNGALTTLGVVMSSSFSVDTKILTEGYLGETVNRFSDVLEGYSFKVKLHLDSEEALIIANAVAARAQAQDPSVKFNATMRATFSGGQSGTASTPRVIFSDLFFDPTNFNIPKKDEFVDVEFTSKTSNFTLLP